ncbi:hypothetical protein HYU20_01250 [Candidatus Woesearchaeota archaeon]|nr:hypothetical protein [Candidatus Woesearchaeota archaeon]
MKQSRKEEDVVYVGIDDPVSLRREVLEASKSLVSVLKGQHGTRDARAAKHKRIEELRNKVTEIGELVAEAKQMLPQTEKISLPEEKKETIVKAKKPAAAATKTKAPALPKARAEAHIDKFEMELQDIEKKLQSL